MLLSGLPRKTRYAVITIVAALSLTAGLSLHGLSLAAAYVAVLPIFVCYTLIVRPRLIRHLRYYHVLYILLLAAMVAGYLMVLARAVPQLRVRWLEVPLAVWFLLTMHVVVWLMDRIVNAGLSAIFGLVGLGHHVPVADSTPTANPQSAIPNPQSGGGGLRVSDIRAVLQTALRVVLLLAIAVPYILSLFAVHWVKFADNTDPLRRCKMAFEPVRMQAADGVSLDGWFLPAAATGAPAPDGTRGEPLPSDTTVIVVPGRGMPKACSLNYAQILCLGRCNVLMFDLRGEGGSAGHSRSFGVREARDVLGAVQYLQESRTQASRHIFAFGISQGAAAVIRAAAADERVRAVVVDSTLTIAQDILPARALLGLPTPVRAYLAAMTRAFASAELGCNLFRQADLAVATARLSPRPLLVIHGAEDLVADPNEATRLYEAAGQPKCLDMVPDAGHGDALLLEGAPYIIRILQLFELARQMDQAS
jgi:pimeloyl-ACP methyl ester carboxylesterase